MNTLGRRRGFAPDLRRRRRARGGRSPAPPSWPLALAGSAAAAGASALLLAPRRGLIAPDPVAVEEYFSAEEVTRLRRFSRPQLALGLAGSVLQGALLVGLVARTRSARPAPRSARARLRRDSSRPDLIPAALAGAGMTAAMTLASLPVRALGRRRALAAGLATQSWAGWATDTVKVTAISTALNATLAPGALLLVARRPRDWWLVGAGAVVAGQAIVAFLAPVVLDPLFNRFTPLPEGPTRSDVLELAKRAGIDVGEVYEVDASRRTTAANAYVTGLGATKRVVLFDTLLRSFSRDEARLVVAHELAHVSHRDVRFGLLRTAVAAPAAMYAARSLFWRLAGSAWRPPEPPAPRSLPALALALGIAGGATGLLAGRVGRRVEARADAFSLRLTDAPDPFISFERRICLQNLADPDPPRWLIALIGTHPPTLERIGIARAYARGAR